MRNPLKRQPLAKFFDDRGTHLAAMIAYFALISFVPLVFLAFALLGFTGQATASSYFVNELQHAFPESSLGNLIRFARTVQRNATTLGIVGGVGVLWSSLSLFSVLESAFNLVYGRPNRSFLHGKALALLLMVTSLIALFAALVVGSIGVDVLNRYAPSILGVPAVAYLLSVAVSLAGVFLFLVSVYYLLTNVHVTVREVLPGSIVATVVVEASFQVLPVYLRITNDVVALQVFGGPAILLVWLYVMANFIVFGAEVNWWRAYGRAQAVAQDAPRPYT